MTASAQQCVVGAIDNVIDPTYDRSTFNSSPAEATVRRGRVPFSLIVSMTAMLASFVVLGITHSSVLAGPILLDTWYQFFSDPNHSPFAAGCLGALPGQCPAVTNTVPLDSPPWTLTASSPVLLTLTDVHLSGDRFDAFDSGTLLGSTPTVGIGGTSCGLDPNGCLADPNFSHATLELAAGSHSLTVFVHAAELNVEGFFRLDPVTEPSTLVLLSASAGGLGLAGWRLRRTARLLKVSHWSSRTPGSTDGSSPCSSAARSGSGMST